MRPSTTSLLAIATLCLLLQYAEREFSVDAAPGDNQACKKVLADLTKRQLNGISACSKSLKLSGKDKAKKMNCILKCVLTNEKMLDESGKFGPAQMDALIQKEFPESLQESANKTFSPCVPHGETMDPDPKTDEFCKSYDPFIKCLLGNLPGLCN